MITAQQVYDAEFGRAAQGTPGYDEVVVDDFLDRVIVTLTPLDRGDALPDGALTSHEVVEAEFPERSGGGYDMDDVDDLLDLVAQRLFAAERAHAQTQDQGPDAAARVSGDAPASELSDDATRVNDEDARSGGVADASALAAAAGAPETSQVRPASEGRTEYGFAPATDARVGTFGEPGVRVVDDSNPTQADAPGSDAAFRSDERPQAHDHMQGPGVEERGAGDGIDDRGGRVGDTQRVNAVGAEPLDESAQVPEGQPAQHESSEGVHPVGSEPDEPAAERDSRGSAGDPRPAEAASAPIPQAAGGRVRTGSSAYVAPTPQPAVSDERAQPHTDESWTEELHEDERPEAVAAAPLATADPVPPVAQADRTVAPVEQERRTDAPTMGGSWDAGIGAERPLVAPNDESTRPGEPAATAPSEAPQSAWAPSEQPAVQPVERPVSGAAEAPVVSYPATDHRVPLPRAEAPRALNDDDREAESQYHPEFSTFSTPEGAEASASFDPFGASDSPVEQRDPVERPEVRHLPSEPSSAVVDNGRATDSTRVDSSQHDATDIDSMRPGYGRGDDDDRGDDALLSQRTVGSRDAEFDPFAAEPTGGPAAQRTGSPVPFDGNGQAAADAPEHDGGWLGRVPAMNEETTTGREPRDPAGAGNPPAPVAAELAARQQERDAARARIGDDAPRGNWGVGRPEPIDAPTSVSDVQSPETIEAPKPLPARDDTSRKGLLRRIFKG